MTALTNGRADDQIRMPDRRLAAIERRFGELANANETRIAALRDAIGDYIATELAERDVEIEALKHKLADLEHQLEQKTTVDRQVHEVAMRLEESQARRDAAKRGAKGEKGERGARGEPGPVGPAGPAGRPAEPVIAAIKADSDAFRLVPFLSSGHSTSATDLKPLLQKFLNEGVQPLVDSAVAELRDELKRGGS